MVEKYKTIFEKAAVGILIAELESKRFRYANPAICKMLGYAEDELLRLSSRDIHPQEALDAVFEEFNELARGIKNRAVAVPCLRRDGKVIYADISASEIIIDDTACNLGFFSDCTERIQAEQALQEIAGHQQALLAAIPDILIEVDAGMTYTWANQQGLDFFGDDVIGRKPDFYFIGAQDPYSKVGSLFRGDETTVYLESLQRRRDGQARLLAWWCRVLKDAHGNVTGAISSARDITEHKRMEETLRESEQQIRTISNNIVNGMIYQVVRLNDGTRKFTYLSDTVLEFYGITPQEGMAHASLIYDRIHEEDRARIHKEEERANETLSIFKTEARVLNHRGEMRWSLFVSRPKKLPDGTTCWDGIEFDITERKQAEDERSQLIAAIEQAQEAIMIAGKDGTLQYVNASFERITGFSKDEILGKNHAVFAQSEDFLRIQQRVWDSLIQGNIWSDTIKVRNKNGVEISVEVVTSPIRNAQGAVTSFVSIARDITKELMMEEQLRQSQKMEAMGTLAGGIAHDFNNILAAIMGYTELAGLDAPESSTQKYNLEQVLRAADRARALVKQILAFSRKQEQQRHPLKLQSLIKEALKMLRATTPTTIEIVPHISNDPGYVTADPTQMHQVLVNLCTNGVHAMQESGGRLEIEFTSVELAEADMAMFPDLHPGRYVKLTVKDTGTGIDPAIMDRIFDPFFTTKEVNKGTGMGLAVVHGIVKSHGGAITVDSRLGAGTVFTILLPRTAEKPAAEQATPASLPHGTEQVLFVDDETILVQAGCSMLAALGYRAVPAHGSAEALALFKNAPSGFDLVMTDQTMPQMTGVELARQLREIRPAIPIILCTGYSEAVDAAKAAELNIQAFVMKPFKLREIAETLRTILDKNVQK
ncbi:MAG: PAS domain S-box protein [Deltaproteobacteria bacterium]|nr:PAS domain S-box protein [Deltaproteobacteria bacterium]